MVNYIFADTPVKSYGRKSFFGKSLIVFYIVKWGGVLLPLKLKKTKNSKKKVVSWAIFPPKIVG